MTLILTGTAGLTRSHRGGQPPDVHKLVSDDHRLAPWKGFFFLFSSSIVTEENCAALDTVAADVEICRIRASVGESRAFSAQRTDHPHGIGTRAENVALARHAGTCRSCSGLGMRRPPVSWGGGGFAGVFDYCCSTYQVVLVFRESSAALNPSYLSLRSWLSA